MGVWDSDDIAGYSPPVHRFGGSAGGADVCAQAAAADGPARDLGRGSRLGGAAGGVFAGHGGSSAGVVDPLHGNGDSFHAAVFVGHTQHYAAGSGLCVRASLYFGGAGGQRGMAAALRAVAAARRGGAAFDAAVGGGVRRHFCRDAFCGEPPPRPGREAENNARRNFCGGGHGADRICREQFELCQRQRSQHEHVLHPHAGGPGRGADFDGAARAAARSRPAQRAGGAGRRFAPPVRAVQAEQGEHPPDQPALPRAENADCGHPGGAGPRQAGCGAGGHGKRHPPVRGGEQDRQPGAGHPADGQKPVLSAAPHHDDLRGGRAFAGLFGNRGDLHDCGHGAGQRNRERGDRARPRKAADPGGGVRPERLCDAAV